MYTQNWTKDDSKRPPGDPSWKEDDPLKPWWPFWIDGGSTPGEVAVTLTPSHDGNISAHEMGHVFGMNHDVGKDLMTDYMDPCCIMSQNNPFTHPTWQRDFGPAICLPHLMQRNWMYNRRVYYDDGAWFCPSLTVLLCPWRQLAAPVPVRISGSNSPINTSMTLGIITLSMCSQPTGTKESKSLSL